MLLRRCGSLPALGITGTPRCTFHRSSTYSSSGRGMQLTFIELDLQRRLVQMTIPRLQH